MENKSIVKVIWSNPEDYRKMYGEWYSLHEVRREITKLHKSTITTIGYNVYEDADWIVIAQNTGDDRYSGIIKIPKKRVKEILRGGWMTDENKS